jgi:phosphate uptake regulator
VGYSTLTVSLPRDWVEDVKLKPGDIISIRREDDGSLNLTPGTEYKHEEAESCVINADLCDSPHLLTRVITGNYILGHDTIQITTKGELNKMHLEEIRTTARRVTGLNIVEQTLKQVTLQSFIDATRFPIYGLMRRLHVIISSMIDASVEALLEGNTEPAAGVTQMEDEADRIYWLITRQLLLVLRDRRMATDIGVDSPLHIVGNRVIAKTLEEIADAGEEVANEVLALNDQHFTSDTTLKEIAKFAVQVTTISEHSFKAFLTGDIKLANDTLESVESVENDERALTQKVLIHQMNASVAASLRIILWNLSQIARYCRIIGEVAINRIMEKPSEICEWPLIQ